LSRLSAQTRTHSSNVHDQRVDTADLELGLQIMGRLHLLVG